ncbi:hypothetical protein BHM03_00031661 [Ensete ventricosum]|nr:hypothetical protein BHM03_00031661 [Ensete ventricosum]
MVRRGGTSVESSIPCSHRGRALVIKEAEEVENAEANSKYQDRTEGQRPRNFIRPVGKARTARYIPVRQLTGMRTSRYRAVPALAACGLRVTAGDFSFRLPARGEIEATVVASSFANSLFSTFSFMLFSFSFLLFPLLSLFIWSRWYTPLQLLIRLSVLVPKRKDHINYMIEPQKELYRF